MRSFAELEKDESVTSAEVAEVLESYATSGAAITSAVVITLISRTNPNSIQREQMKASAQKGQDTQTRRRFASKANAYRQVIQHLNQ